ncbi:YafY family protein [Aestuariivita sp.]|jgi:predicted DNA-binding transcriptional regulator YafY|uniref:helix-turn-helix transcriptional regulator n=1 Tax=Aestuariivita sp. TaxID=1872407 RepID=UPI002171EAC9|nr:YafY family protein [Aestuariivita sp.]MCE8008072.1 YafY family transcriptional regulator [Aestuariivita sp.]
MHRSNRLFEIIQLLRAADQPLRAEDLGAKLEVSTRTIYRDIAALQAMRTPIEGESGVGYMMRRGYDLPPLNFDREEVEALWVGLSMLTRTGDIALQRAARRICAKIEALHDPADWLQVAPWGAPLDDPDKGCVPMSLLRQAVREERKLRLTYRDDKGHETTRDIRPVALIYHLECVMLGAWCELRDGLRHFRTDRILGCEVLEARFQGQSATLRALWLEQNGWSDPSAALSG